MEKVMKIVKSKLTKQVQELFDDYDKNPDWTSRDIFLSTILKKFDTNQYGDVAEIIADWYAHTPDDNFDHSSIAMDIVASLVFFEGDFDSLEFLLQDMPPHPKSNLRGMLLDAMETCKRDASKVEDYRECFMVTA